MPKFTIQQPLVKEIKPINSKTDQQQSNQMENDKQSTQTKIIQPNKKQLVKAYTKIQNIDDADINQQEFEKIMEKLKQKKEKQKPAQETLKSSKSSDKSKQKTDDDLQIFTADELKIGQPGSGNTKLCPFDCDCCF